MAVDDHGIEVLKKSGEEMVPGSKADYYIKTGLVLDGQPISDINPLPVSASSTAGGATTPTITNFTVASPNVEESHVLQTNLRKISIRSRSPAKIQFAFVATESSTKFITINPNSTYSEDGLNLSGKTLYFQLNNAPGIVEILEWN